LEERIRINHQYYVDDLKLYAALPVQLNELIDEAVEASNDVGMSLGLAKCAITYRHKTEYLNTGPTAGFKILAGCVACGVRLTDPLYARISLLSQGGPYYIDVANTTLHQV
jgi:hypothetical protein